MHQAPSDHHTQRQRACPRCRCPTSARRLRCTWNGRRHRLGVSECACYGADGRRARALARPAAGANSGDLGTRNQPTPDSISSIPGHPCALCILITRCNFRPASWIPMRRLLLRPRHNGKRFRTVLISKLGIMRKIGAFCFVLFLLFATATHPNS